MMYDIIMFRQTFCNINKKHLYIRAICIRLIPRWLCEDVEGKYNTKEFISIVSVQQQLLK